jgi:aminoglycoside phosphotransferase (APT) family kinase protein
LRDRSAWARLAAFIAQASAAEAVQVEDARLLRGGAVQENWRIFVAIRGGSLAGRRSLVLRTSAGTALGMGLGRAEEFAVLAAVAAAGIAVPAPLLLCRDGAVIGKAFFLMEDMPGSADGQRIVEARLDDAPERLAQSLGREIAALHRLRPPHSDLAFLGPAPADPAQARCAEYGRVLEGWGEPHPVAEWGLRWLRRHAPAPLGPVLCHGDFRTGNFLVDEAGLTAILDWEFAGWSDPYEDIGWFCSACWRFGARRREAGGIASRDAFYRGYEAASGRPVDPARAHYWEVMAALRWLIIAIRQRDRFLEQGEPSLQRALTGRRPAECDFEILRLTEAAGEAA